MKQITTNLYDILKKQDLSPDIENLSSRNPNIQYGDVSITEVLDKYIFIRGLLLQSIENGTFDDVPYNRRNSIFSTFNALAQYRNNPQQLISHLENILDQINIAGLIHKQQGQNDFYSEYKDLIKLRKYYSKLIKAIEDSQEAIDFIKKQRSR